MQLQLPFYFNQAHKRRHKYKRNCSPIICILKLVGFLPPQPSNREWFSKDPKLLLWATWMQSLSLLRVKLKDFKNICQDGEAGLIQDPFGPGLKLWNDVHGPDCSDVGTKPGSLQWSLAARKWLQQAQSPAMKQLQERWQIRGGIFLGPTVWWTEQGGASVAFHFGEKGKGGPEGEQGQLEDQKLNKENL